MNVTGKPRGFSFWKTHISTWKSSGLSKEAYCEREGLSLECFKYQYGRSQGKQKKSGFHFIEAKVTKRAAEAISGLKIQLPNGVVISIEAEVNSTLLQMILSSAGLPC